MTAPNVIQKFGTADLAADVCGDVRCRALPHHRVEALGAVPAMEQLLVCSASGRRHRNDYGSFNNRRQIFPYSIVPATAKTAAPRPSRMSGCRSGRQIRHVATERAIPQANALEAPDCRITNTPARTSPAAMGASPESIAICHREPRWRFPRNAPPHSKSDAGKKKARE